MKFISVDTGKEISFEELNNDVYHLRIGDVDTGIPMIYKGLKKDDIPKYYNPNIICYIGNAIRC